MKNVNAKQKQWLITAHVVFAAMWFGTVLSMIAIAFMNRNTVNGDELYAINSAIELLDNVIVIPSATLSLLSGGLICWLTVWGFFKHYWVIAKWIGTVTLIVTGTTWLGPWTNAMTAISAEERLQALQNPLYVFDKQAVLIGGIIQTLCLLFIIAISFVKPWGKRDTKPHKQASAN